MTTATEHTCNFAGLTWTIERRDNQSFVSFGGGVPYFYDYRTEFKRGEYHVEISCSPHHMSHLPNPEKRAQFYTVVVKHESKRRLRDSRYVSTITGAKRAASNAIKHLEALRDNEFYNQ